MEQDSPGTQAGPVGQAIVSLRLIDEKYCPAHGPPYGHVYDNQQSIGDL